MITLKNPGQESAAGDGPGGFYADTIERSWPGDFNMGARIEYQKGQKFGNVTFIEDVDSIKRKKGNRTDRAARFKCFCGKEFIQRFDRIRTGINHSCGCLTPGVVKNPLYRKWCSMKARCAALKCKKTRYYHDRGIVVCDEWKNDFMAFYNYVSKLENYGKKGYTIDRINNDENYEPGNVRWADYHTQSVNSRIKNTNTSGVVGVSFHKTRKKWAATIDVRKKRMRLGTYNTIEEATQARNNYILEHKLFEYQLQLIINQ